MYCPSCKKIIKREKFDRWETCHECGCVFKILNTPEEQWRGW